MIINSYSKINFFLYSLLIILFIDFNSALSYDLYQSDFHEVKLNTKNADLSKKESIERIKYETLLSILDKILDKNNKNKFIKKIDSGNLINEFLQNIIIENEIITNEKYIADIKINFDKKKIMNFLRNNNINYSDTFSDQFLILSSYNFEFINLGIQKNNLFYKSFFKNKSFFKTILLNYDIPSISANDRYILSYKKLVNEDKEAFVQILEKYKKKQALYIKIEKKNYNIFLIEVIKFEIKNKKFEKKINFQIDVSNIKKEESIEKIIMEEISLNLENWWRNEVLIDNNKLNQIECSIFSKNFDNLNFIKLNIKNLSQVKDIKIKKIKLNNNTENILYYGDISILIRGLLNKGIILNNKNNDCEILTI